jgi:hypothetical protein
LWAKGLNAKDIHKEMFPVYDGKCLLHEAVEKFSERRSKVADYAQPGAEVAGFDALVKQCGKCINVDGGYVDR